ncbi:MAG: AMP-binding protein, partial [Frankia sp.]
MTAPDVYRLSPTQRRAWLSAAGAGPRLLTVRARVSGLAEADLGPAVAAVTARHEATRLRFVQHADLRTPVQTVDDEYQAPGAAVVFALAGDDLVISGSALVVDPASLVVLLVDLARAVDGTLVEEPEPLQLLDVSEWQHEQLDQVAPPPVATLTPLALPFPPAGATSDPGASASGSGELRVRLAGEAARRLVEAAAVLPGLDPAGPGSEPAGERTVETLVVAAWAQALSRYRDDADDDLVLAWYGGGRSVDGTDQVVGPLGHYGPLRVSGAAAGPGPFVAGVREALNAAGARQHLVEPLDSANVALDAGGVAFLTGVEVSAVKALGATAVTLDRPEPVGGLHLGAELTTDRLDLTLRYDRSRYADDSARRLLDAVAAILGSLPDALSGAGELRLLGAEETELLDRWSGPDQPAGDERTLLDVLNGGVRGADGTATAVVAADGTLTFADLDRAAGGLARHLRARGVAAGERVVVVGERSWRTIVAFLGVLRAGAVYVPVDPDGPPARIVRLARAVDAALVVGPPARRDLLDGLAGDLPVAALDDEVLRTDDEVLAADVDDRAGRSIGPGDAAYVIFTSGSTGAPHPVVVEHGSAASLFDALCATIYADRRDRLRVAVNAPFVFDASIKQMIQLGAGHTLYLVPAAVRADGSELLRYLTGQRIDVFDGTPSHLRALLGAWPSASAGSTGPPASTGSAAAHPGLLLVGGEPIDARLWSELAALPRVHAINLYGPTECTVDATAARIDATSEPSIGRPLPGVRVSILDGAGRPVPAGAPGELYLTGRQVARGYLGDADTTGRRFAGTWLHNGMLRFG